MIELVIETDAHEGPVYVERENALYFTTQRRGSRVDIRRLDLAERAVTTVRADANAANGMTLSPDGRLLVCEQGTTCSPAAITRVDPVSGSAETVVDAWCGRPLNSPNDIVVKTDGTVWFTDPSYGHVQGFRPPPQLGDRVYRHDPATGTLDVVAECFDKPNGLAFSPDELVLYVGDSGRPRRVKAFDVVAGRRLGAERVFAAIEPGAPDGLKTDASGRVYVTFAGGVKLFEPDGRLLREIPVPGAVNFAFVGDALFITADDAIWAASLKGA